MEKILIVISILVGFAMNMAGDKAEPVYKFMDSCSEIVNNLIKIIMYYAPIGLGCYFASLVGTFGGEIAVGYLKTFVIYLVTAIFFYFVIYTIFFPLIVVFMGLFIKKLEPKI